MSGAPLPNGAGFSLVFDRARTRELPDHYSYIVTKRLIMISTEKWSAPSHDLLGKVYEILVREVNKMTDDRFRRFRYGGLHQRVKCVRFFVFCGVQEPISRGFIIDPS